MLMATGIPTRANQDFVSTGSLNSVEDIEIRTSAAVSRLVGGRIGADAFEVECSSTATPGAAAGSQCSDGEVAPPMLLPSRLIDVTGAEACAVSIEFATSA